MIRTRRTRAALVRVAALAAVGAGLCGCAASAPRPYGELGIRETLPADLPPQARTLLHQLAPLPDLPPGTEPVGREVPPQALQHYLAGLALMKEYRDTEAISHFEAAVKLDPQAFAPRMALARVALRSGAAEKAMLHLRAAVRLRPGDSEAHHLLGRLALQRGRDCEALEHLRYALRLAESDAQRAKTCFYLAQALDRQGFWLAAVEICRRFELLSFSVPPDELPDPQWRDLVVEQGWRMPAIRAACLRRLGQAGSAIEAYESALKRAPERSDILIGLAEALIDAGHFQRATSIATELLSRDPENADALAILAATLAGEGKIDELRTRLASLIQQHPTSAVLAERCATVLAKFGQHEAALRVLLDARQSVPRPEQLYPAMLRMVFARPDVASAVGALQQLLEVLGPKAVDRFLASREAAALNPDLVADLAARGEEALAKAAGDPVASFALAVLAEAAGRDSLTSRALQAALQAQADYLPAALALAQRHMAKFHWDEAIDLLRPLREKYSDVPAVYRLLGAAYEGLDQYRAALVNIYAALRHDARDTGAMWLAGRINDRLGQVREAAEIYRAIVKLRPDDWPAQLAYVRNLLLLRQVVAARRHAAQLAERFGEVPAAALCQLLATVGSPVAPSKQVQQLVDRFGADPVLLQALAEGYLTEGEPAKAIEVLLDLLETQPGHQQARALLVTALAKVLRLDLAEQVVQSLLAEHPNRPQWLLARAELLTQSGRPAAAIEIYRRLLASASDANRKQMLLGRLTFALQFAGKPAAAVELLQKELQHSAGNRAVQALLLGALETEGERGKALELLRSWRRAEPNDPLLKRWHIQVLRSLKAYDSAAVEAMRDWLAGGGQEMPRRGSPQTAEAQRPDKADLALLAAALPEAQAQAWLRNRAWQGADDWLVVTLAELAADAGNFAEAAELSVIGPDEAVNLTQRAQWLFLAGKRAAAELLVMPALQRASRDAYDRLRRLLPVFYKRYGLDRLAVRATESLYKKHRTERARAHEYANDLAYTWAEMDIYLAEAEELARQAVAAEPVNAAYLDTLAWVYYKHGRFDLALECLQRAVRVPQEGKDPVLHDHLGDVLWRLGRHSEALEAWRKSVELFRQEREAGSIRPDLAQAEQVERKIAAAEAGGSPAVAGWPGDRAGSE